MRERERANGRETVSRKRERGQKEREREGVWGGGSRFLQLPSYCLAHYKKYFSLHLPTIQRTDRDNDEHRERERQKDFVKFYHLSAIYPYQREREMRDF